MADDLENRLRRTFAETDPATRTGNSLLMALVLRGYLTPRTESGSGLEGRGRYRRA